MSQAQAGVPEQAEREIGMVTDPREAAAARHGAKGVARQVRAHGRQSCARSSSAAGDHAALRARPGPDHRPRVPPLPEADQVAPVPLVDGLQSKPFQVRLLGKGRKARTCPPWPQTAQLLRALCTERQLDLRSEARVNHRGTPLARFGVRFILAKAPSPRGEHLSRPGAETPAPAQPAAQHRGAPAQIRRRPAVDRPLARACQRQYHQSLPPIATPRSISRTSRESPRTSTRWPMSCVGTE